MKSVIESLGSSVDKLRAMNDSSIFRRNLLKIEVYFEEFNYEKVEEFPKYPLTKLFSDIGGIIGLWIGCSVLSLVEFLELGMDLFVLAFYKLSKKKYWARTHRGVYTRKNSSINPAATGNVLGSMEETSLSNQRNSGRSNNNKLSTQYGGFMARRNSMKNSDAQKAKNRAIGSHRGSINTGFQIPGIILEDVFEDTETANGAAATSVATQNPRSSPSYYDERKRKDKTHKSYLSRMTNLARKPLSAVSGKREKKDKSPPPPTMADRENLPHVEGGLRIALSQMYDDRGDDSDTRNVRHRGQFSGGNAPFKFI